MSEVANNAKAGGLSLWHSLIAGVVCGWVLATQVSENRGDVFASLSNLQRFSQPGFLGMVAGMAMAPIGGGVLGWLAAKAVPSLRKSAPLIALLGTVAIFLAMLVGENSQNKQQANVKEQVNAASRSQPQPTIVPSTPSASPATTSASVTSTIAGCESQAYSAIGVQTDGRASIEYLEKKHELVRVCAVRQGLKFKQSGWTEYYMGLSESIHKRNGTWSFSDEPSYEPNRRVAENEIQKQVHIEQMSARWWE